MATKTPKTEPLTFEPDPADAALVRVVDADLDQRLTGPVAVESIAQALRDAALEFEPEEVETLAAASTLQIQDESDYTRGYDLLSELGHIEDRITKHYSRFDKPLNFLARVVRAVKSPQVEQVTPLKQALSKRLGAWKVERQRLDREEREKKQQIADAAAKAAQEARAAMLDRVASAEPNPALAKSFEQEAAQVRAAAELIKAAPVETTPSVPVVPGGHSRRTWKCEFVDVKVLLQAYLDGKCFLDEQAIIDGLQQSMDRQATSLQHNLGRAFPGTQAVPTDSAVVRRK